MNISIFGINDGGNNRECIGGLGAFLLGVVQVGPNNYIRIDVGAVRILMTYNGSNIPLPARTLRPAPP